jgi:uroporphyrinogen-III synthase
MMTNVAGARDGALRGAGILVTRPARQAAALAAQIAAIGGVPLIFPAIVVVPPDDTARLDAAKQNLDRYDAVVFVSANAVEFGVDDGSQWPSRTVCFAPGPGTAAALATIGINGVRTPTTTMDSEGLLALPELSAVRGQRIAIFRGNGGRDLLGRTLEKRGAHVDYVECYRRCKPQAGASGLLAAWRERRIDGVTITSSEGLDNLWDVVGKDGQAQLAATPLFASHARIAERAAALGFREVVVTAPADSGLLAALIEYFAAHVAAGSSRQ